MKIKKCKKSEQFDHLIDIVTPALLELSPVGD